MAALDKEGNTLARSYHTSQDTWRIRGSAITPSYDELFADLRNRGIDSGQVAEIHDIHTHPGQVGNSDFTMIVTQSGDRLYLEFPSRYSRDDIRYSYWAREKVKKRYPNATFSLGIIYELDDERAKKRIFEMRPQAY